MRTLCIYISIFNMSGFCLYLECFLFYFPYISIFICFCKYGFRSVVLNVKTQHTIIRLIVCLMVDLQLFYYCFCCWQQKPSSNFCWFDRRKCWRCQRFTPEGNPIYFPVGITSLRQQFPRCYRKYAKNIKRYSFLVFFWRWKNYNKLYITGHYTTLNLHGLIWKSYPNNFDQ